MTTRRNSCGVRQLQGFDAFSLRNDALEIEVVPQLGARIISLKNMRTQRDWLWHPGGSLTLFANRPMDDFSVSPLAGIDECLPTIAPCSWRGRQLPDHGEVWNAAWHVCEKSWGQGILRTTIRLACAPFEFQRTIALDGNKVNLDYELSNVGANDEDFIWAFHPLLRLAGGDQLELPNSTSKLIEGADWIDAVDSAVPPNKCSKIFARPVAEGRAAIRNEALGDRLLFTWDAAQNNALGLWLTRGGWHGHHHFAIEPTNADNDSLAVAAEHKRCGRVGSQNKIAWQLSLQVGI